MVDPATARAAPAAARANGMRGASPSHGLAAPPTASMRARRSALVPCRVPCAASRARQVAACCSAPPTLSAVETPGSRGYSSLLTSSTSLVMTVTLVSCTLSVLLAAVCVLIPATARISVGVFLAFFSTLLVAVLPPAAAHFFATAAAQELRDKTAAEQRKADVAAAELRDKAAAEQRKADVAAQELRDKAAAEQRRADVAAQELRDKAAAEQRKVDVAAQEARDESLKTIFAGFKMSTSHRVESVAAGLNNLRTSPDTAQPPAATWSAAEVSESSPALR